VRSALNAIKPFKVDFTQQVFIDEELEIEESGSILFKNSKVLKWTYKDPDFKIFLLTKDEFQFYDKENNQLTRGKISEKNQQWIWQLLFSDEISPYIRCDEKQRRIYVKHKAEDMDFEIQVDENSFLKKVIQYDSAGAKYIYYFKTYKKKVKVSKKDFELELPSDVDIIDEYLD
jgi:outer membrane lipoprotein-sorting protein